VTVAAASSLTETLAALEGDLAAGDLDVTLSLGGSNALATQILEGAPVDVFAAADQESVQRLVDANVVADAPVAFATNSLAIVTPPGNPDGIADVADLASVGTVAVCVPEAPCGRAATTMLANARVVLDESRLTRATNVKEALSAVEFGDAAAAIVYVTDARAAGDAVHTVEVPSEINATTTYVVAVLRASSAPAAAQHVVDLLTGPRGQDVLASLGFGPP
jgi:molybdate transport system substrate-binding protein